MTTIFVQLPWESVSQEHWPQGERPILEDIHIFFDKKPVPFPRWYVTGRLYISIYLIFHCSNDIVAPKYTQWMKVQKVLYISYSAKQLFEVISHFVFMSLLDSMLWQKAFLVEGEIRIYNMKFSRDSSILYEHCFVYIIAFAVLHWFRVVFNQI